MVQILLTITSFTAQTCRKMSFPVLTFQPIALCLLGIVKEEACDVKSKNVGMELSPPEKQYGAGQWKSKAQCHVA